MVRSCGQCGAVSPAEARWCGQCYLPFPAAAPQSTSAESAGQPAAAPAAAQAHDAVAAPPPSLPVPRHPGWRPPAHEPAVALAGVAPAASAPAWAPPGWTPPGGAPTGWVPPGPPPVAGWVPAAPPAPPYTAEDARRDGRLLDRRALVLVISAIVFGGIAQLVAYLLSRNTSIEPDTLIRYDIVLTLGVYLVVGGMIASQITPSVRLRWGDGPLLSRIVFGAGFGAVISGALLGLVSLAAGHLAPDPRIVLLMSEGDPTHIAAAVVIGCLAAPLVEETLFRGLLLESLRPRGTPVAILGSAAAFAVWHFMPASLVYYAAMGAVLGGLYLKRGLACSMAAHFAFNGVLTVAAIAVVLGPSHVVTMDGLTITVPSGWSTPNSASGELLPDSTLLVGPDDASLAIIATPSPQVVDPSTIVERLRSDQVPVATKVVLDPSSITEVAGHDATIVEESFTYDGRSGVIGATSPDDGYEYELVFLSAGSARATRDFQQMITTMND